MCNCSLKSVCNEENICLVVLHLRLIIISITNKTNTILFKVVFNIINFSLFFENKLIFLWSCSIFWQRMEPAYFIYSVLVTILQSRSNLVRKRWGQHILSKASCNYSFARWANVMEKPCHYITSILICNPPFQ